MRVVIQRAQKASVKTNNHTAKIKKGLVILIAATHSDSSEDVNYLAKKIVNLRIFSDDKGLMNINIKEAKGEILLVSQFTLYSRTRKGNRPSFIDAAKPENAKKLYQELIEALVSYDLIVKTGVFGKYMKVKLTNDGPVTIIIDTDEKQFLTKKKKF